MREISSALPHRMTETIIAGNCCGASLEMRTNPSFGFRKRFLVVTDDGDLRRKGKSLQNTVNLVQLRALWAREKVSGQQRMDGQSESVVFSWPNRVTDTFHLE